MATDISSERPGSKVLSIGNVDVRNFDTVKAAVDRCVKELGSIDFVIKSAGAAGNFLASMDNLSVNAFKAVIDIDLIGSWVTVKATIPHLLESARRHRGDGKSVPRGTGGRIIFVSSTNYHNARVAQAHACAAKAGVNAISDVLSLEYGPQGVTSNIIAPGAIAGTEGMDRLVATDSREDSRRNIPLQRFGLVKEIADATVFLFGDTGNFINGVCLDVDGGAWRVKGGGQFGGKPYPESVHPVQGLDGKGPHKL
ncbi:hypothetical protein H2204_001978 [Knufia peltigerae]|uniref:2,4-dienoyl-CoA reductase [(3E)-enoyl-CoA-producing] n=1 Tax=Knufia peltigerae TaxID=1002370 RepID=A0AA38YCA2_9EURO|nr:hypothetical protein H2204_001978 [Knufia peltigerae]